MKLVKRYFSFFTSLMLFNFIIRILSNKVNEKNLDYSFSFNSKKISSNKLKIEMLDYNNHSLSDLSKLILIRTSFDKKINEYEINIDNNNFNKEKNKIYFILDFFDNEIYQVKYIYNKNNILIKDYLKINENIIFRLNKIRKLEDIPNYSPSSFKLLENEMILTIEYNNSDNNKTNYHLQLRGNESKIIPKDKINSKVRFDLTELNFTTVGIYYITFSYKETIISDNIKIYIYNNHVKLKRNKDYILNNTDIENNTNFSIYLEYSVFKDQFKVKKFSTRMDATTIDEKIPDDINSIPDTEAILTNETIIQVSNISYNNYTNIIIIDLADNNAVHNFSIYSSKYIINNNLIFYKSSSIVDVTQPFEVNITTLKDTKLDNIIVNNGYKNETVNCKKNETLHICNGKNITSIGNREFSLYIGNESINIRTVYIIYYNIEKSCQMYPNLSPIIINTYYPKILTENFNLYSTMNGYGTKFDNKTTTSSYSITQTIFNLSIISQYSGIHNLYALITDYDGEKNYIKDEYLFILEKKYVDDFEIKENESDSRKYLTNTNNSQLISLSLNDNYIDETIENIYLYKDNVNPIRSDNCSKETVEEKKLKLKCYFSNLSSVIIGLYDVGYINSCENKTFFYNKTKVGDEEKNIQINIL